MRGQVALTIGLLALAAPGGAQSPATSTTAEQMIETAREIYSVDEPEPEPCPTSTGSEIVVCRQLEDGDQYRVASPTERANAQGRMPPDPVPNAPDVFGLPPCKSQTVCVKVGRAPPPIYIIDLEAIPEPLTAEEAALVVRAADQPNPEAASPAAAP